MRPRAGRASLAGPVLALALAGSAACRGREAPPAPGAGSAVALRHGPPPTQGDGRGGPVLSCDVPAERFCREWWGDTLAQQREGLTRLCKMGIGARLAEAPCPTSMVVTTCKLAGARYYYYAGQPSDGPPFVDAELAHLCAQDGGAIGQ